MVLLGWKSRGIGRGCRIYTTLLGWSSRGVRDALDLEYVELVLLWWSSRGVGDAVNVDDPTWLELKGHRGCR